MTRPGVPMMICAPALQAAELALVALPAVDRQLAHAALEERELRDFLGDLHGELARRAEDQDLRRAQTAIDLLDRREWQTPPSCPSRSAIARPHRALRAGSGSPPTESATPPRNPTRATALSDLRREAEFGEKFLLHSILYE